MEKSTLSVIYDDLFLTDYPTASCESPDRVSSIMEVLRKYYPVISPSPASEDDILAVHTRGILKTVQDDPLLYPAAIMAAGAAILGARTALEGRPTFAAVRPPGHHASPGSHWGFCFFNNVAIAIQHVLTHTDITSALILDIDLHFGDGTDRFFMNQPNVTVANIQDNHREIFLQNVDQVLAQTSYDIIAVSAGFDRHIEDWGCTLKTEDYFRIGRSVRDFARIKCNGRYFAVLEGGYNTDVLGENALALCQGMDTL